MEGPANPVEGKTAATLSNAERWVDDHGDYLFSFALMRLRDPVKAEDAVQETFLAALRGGNAFAGRSAERSWLAGILKNKICDHFRKAGREISFTDLDFYSDGEHEGFTSDTFGKSGWEQEHAPREWGDFGQSLDNALFWKAYRQCCDKLPEKIAAAFNLRELDGIESKEVCALLKISEANLWVMLHRARMALRRCLETNWFGRDR